MRTILLTLLVIYHNCLSTKCNITEIFTEPSYELLVDLPESSEHVPHLDGRIVGGTPVNITQVPYQISLQYKGQHICGGSIIHRSFILTAAHCLYGKQPTRFQVRAGSTFISSGGEISKVCSTTQHGKYNRFTIDNDIAIIKLCKSLTFGEGIKTVRLPKQGELFRAGLLVIASGWGRTYEGSNITESLQQVEVPIVEQQTCKRSYRSITDNMICVGETKGGKGPCQGDSGGPLVSNGTLVGVASWSDGCARPLSPGVYTKVSKYRYWIKNFANI